MDILSFLQELLHNLIYGPDFGVAVDLALGPLAIAGIALAAGAGLGATNYILGGKQRRRLRDRANRIDALRGESMEAQNEQIRALLGRAEGIDTDQTAQELYGESIQSLTDRVEGGRATAGRQLSRSLMAGGGDITGSMNSLLQRLTQQSNRSIQDIMNEYNERTDRRNLQNQRRQDQLLTSALSARGGQFASLSGLAESAFDRSAQKATADKQFLMDAIGLGGNIGSQFATLGG